MRLLPAYPYFGSKAMVADAIWEAFGDPPNFVDCTGGCCAVALARPWPGKIETINELFPFIPNFYRAVQNDPEGVAYWATWPVSELDMHARFAWLIDWMTEERIERLRADPDFFSAKVAGWWVWGASIWIGPGWCDEGHRRAGARRTEDGQLRVSRKRPDLAGSNERPHGGRGIFRAHRKIPHLSGKGQLTSFVGPDGDGVGYGRGIFASGRREDLYGYFQKLTVRLQTVRFTCGDWRRVVTPAVTISHGLTAVFMDPPYGRLAKRTKGLYACDSDTVAAEMCSWALEHGDDPRYRIALCGYEGEHVMPTTWREHAWKANGGFGNQDGENANAARERVWFSPHCLGGAQVAGPLFAHAAAGEA